MIEVWVWLHHGCGSFRELVEQLGPQNMELRGVHPAHPERAPDPIHSNLFSNRNPGRWIKIKMEPVDAFDALNCIDTTDWSDVS